MVLLSLIKLMNLKVKKNQKNIKRKVRKRDGSLNYRGISHEQVCMSPQQKEIDMRFLKRSIRVNQQ